MAFNFDKKIRNFKKAQKTLPLVLGNMAKNHFLQSFKDEGFTDRSFSAWAGRSTQNRSDRRARGRRALLVDSGHMRRSIRVIRASFSRTVVGSEGVPYAKYHNDPKQARVHRKFIGKSEVLRKKHVARVRRELKNIF